MKRNTIIKHFGILLLLISISSYTAKAQFNFGISLNYAICTDDLTAGTKNGYGATFHANYDFSEYLMGCLNVGYVTFANQNNDSKISRMLNGKDLYLIPVTVGVKVYVASYDDKPGAKQPSDNKLRPYFGLDLGMATGNLNLVTGNAFQAAVIAPQFGVDYKLNESVKLRFSAINNLLIYNRLAYGSDVLDYVGINVGGILKF